jgi:hypothetical protein
MPGRRSSGRDHLPNTAPEMRRCPNDCRRNSNLCANISVRSVLCVLKFCSGQYRWSMTQSDPAVDESLTEALARVGIAVTVEGKDRARRRLADAEAGWTPERHEHERAKLGLQSRAA